MLPVRQGRAVCVDHGLEHADEPVHRLAPAALKVTVPGHVDAVGGVLVDAGPVFPVVAFERRDDQRDIAVVQELAHAPALAVGRVLVKKDVVPVEHIQDREAKLRAGLRHGRQIDVSGAFFFSGEGRKDHCLFFDHVLISDAVLVYDAVYHAPGQIATGRTVLFAGGENFSDFHIEQGRNLW